MAYSKVQEENAQLRGKFDKVHEENTQLRDKLGMSERTIQLCAVQQAEVSQAMSKLKKENARLKEEIKTLQEENAKLTLANTALTARVVVLEDDKARLEAHLTCSDLIRLYVSYRVLPEANQSWSEICDQVSNKQAELDDGEITPQEFKDWTDQKFGGMHLEVGIPKLRTMAKDRNTQVHEDLRAATKQKQFIANLEAYPWPAGFPYVEEAKTMIVAMKSQKLRRL